MNLNYAIFRSEPIMTTQDLSQIGSHNKREKQAYNSNPEIKRKAIENNSQSIHVESKYSKNTKQTLLSWLKNYVE